MPNLNCTCLVCTYGINYDDTNDLNLLKKREEHVYNITWFNLVGDYERNPIPVPIIRTNAVNPIEFPVTTMLQITLHLVILLIMLLMLEHMFYTLQEIC
jgi:hypothetical protein